MAVLSGPENKSVFKQKSYNSYKLQNTSKWVTQKEIYDIIMSEGDYYEPYFVTKRNTMFYDEIFNSYGYN